MRKFIIAAALVTTALTGAAGCADNSKPGTDATSAPAATTATDRVADQTKAVCTEAISTSTAATAAFTAKFTEFLAAAASGDTAKFDTLEADFAKLANDWKGKLTELSTKPIKAEVKTALTDGIAKVEQITSEDGSLTAEKVQADLATFNTKLAAACA